MNEEAHKPPTPGVAEVTEEELDTISEEVPEQDFTTGEAADEDETIDNHEQEEQPHQDLPEGTRASDYEKELQDGAEETPSAHRGQRRG